MQVFLFSWQVLDCFCDLASEYMQCHFHHTLLVTRKSSLHVFKEREVRLLLLMARWKWQGSRTPNGMGDNVIRIGKYDLLQSIVWPQMYIYICVFLLHAKYVHSLLGFPGGSDRKASACNAGDPGVGKIPREGNGNPLQYPCLENPMDGGAW